MDFIVTLVDSIESTYKVSYLYQMRSIGQSYLPALAKHRDYLEQMIKSSHGQVQEACQSCVDIIEGRR